MHDRQQVIRILRAASEGDISALRSLGLTAQHELDSRAIRDVLAAGPVHHAARAGKLDAVQYLVEECHSRARSTSQIGATAAHDAAATGRLECLKWLLQNTDCELDDRDADGATVLHLAARYGHLRTLKWLVSDAGAPIQVKSRARASPLHFAASNGHLDAVKFLVEHCPVIVNDQVDSGATAAYLACQEGHLEVLRYLVEEGGASLQVLASDGMSCLHAAAQMGQLHCIQWLIQIQCLDVNDRDYDGATALHFACGRGHLPVVKWLLENGAFPAMQDKAGSTPLHEAAQQGHLACVRILMQTGCNIRIVDHDGFTADQLADLCWQAECAAVLKKKSQSYPNLSSRVHFDDALSDVSASSRSSGDYCSLPRKNQRKSPPDYYNLPPLGEHTKPPEEGYFTNSSEASTVVTKISVASQTEEFVLNPAPPPPPAPPLPVAAPPAPPPPPAPPSVSSSLRRPSDGSTSFKLRSTHSAPKIPVPGSSSSSLASASPSMDLIAELKVASRASTLKRNQKREELKLNEGKSVGVGGAGRSVKTNFEKMIINKTPAKPTPPKKAGVDKSVLVGEFDPKNFLDKVEASVPDWRKMIIARQMAEKAYKESEEARKKEEEESRWHNVPPWKRALLEKKEQKAKQEASPKDS